MKGTRIRKAAVLGAGVMGAQIAAHLINAGIETVLFDLPVPGNDPNANVDKALHALRTLDPAPLALPDRARDIQQANYEEHLPLLGECDLVIEAIAERIDLKTGLYRRLAPHLGREAILCTNTSGLSVNALADALPPELQARFCGVHFFNPPRYMYLVELVPAARTDPALLDALESFLVTTLGKGVVRAKDTPNFIANRVGVFGALSAIHHADRLQLGFDEVDAITGTLLGRPKSATFRTLDVVGLDTFAHVVDTMREHLPDDPWHDFFRLSPWLGALVEKGVLGQKTRGGIYRKVGREIRVLDPGSGEYRASGAEVDPEVGRILALPDAVERLAALRESRHPQAVFVWSCLRDLFHYAAYHLHSIADSAREVDLAIRWGYGWRQGPFETWQEAGWPKVAHWLAEDIEAGLTMVRVPLPAWVLQVDRSGVHTPQGSWSPAGGDFKARPALPVYRRQLFPDRLVGEGAPVYGEAVFDNDSVRVWHTGDEIAVVSFKSKLHTVDEGVIDGLLHAVDIAERDFKALVVWQPEAPFCAGANLRRVGGKKGSGPPSTVERMLKKWKRTAESAILKAAFRLNVADALMAGRLGEVEAAVEHFQLANQALKYALVPTVAAVDGLALGGGCEILMHCSRVVATLESYVGLVEAGVGLIPAGGGCKELVLRASREAESGDPFPLLQRYFRNVAMAEVAKSAEQARSLGYLRPADRIVMNRLELLHAARTEANAMAEEGHRPPLRERRINVAGSTGLATLRMALVNLLEGGQISGHDHLIADKLAQVMCGGEVDAGSVVDEQWLLDLERNAFMELLATEKTQQRIEHMLQTGKPLRN